MEILKTERLDHLGIVMGTIKELGIVKFIDIETPPSKDGGIKS